MLVMSLVDLSKPLHVLIDGDQRGIVGIHLREIFKLLRVEADSTSVIPARAIYIGSVWSTADYMLLGSRHFDPDYIIVVSSSSSAQTSEIIDRLSKYYMGMVFSFIHSDVDVLKKHACDAISPK